MHGDGWEIACPNCGNMHPASMRENLDRPGYNLSIDKVCEYCGIRVSCMEMYEGVVIISLFPFFHPNPAYDAEGYLSSINRRRN
jgi:hypothetical protein